MRVHGMLLLLSVVGLCFDSGTLADDPPAAAPPLTGTYAVGSEGTVQLTAEGGGVEAVWIERADTSIFAVGDWAFHGKVSGQTITGSMHLRFPLSFKDACGNWDHQGDLTLTISADGQTIQGSHEVWQIHKKDCKMEKVKDPSPILLKRVDKRQKGTVSVGPLDDSL